VCVCWLCGKKNWWQMFDDFELFYFALSAVSLGTTIFFFLFFFAFITQGFKMIVHIHTNSSPHIAFSRRSHKDTTTVWCKKKKDALINKDLWKAFFVITVYYVTDISHDINMLLLLLPRCRHRRSRLQRYPGALRPPPATLDPPSWLVGPWPGSSATLSPSAPPWACASCRPWFRMVSPPTSPFPLFSWA